MTPKEASEQTLQAVIAHVQGMMTFNHAYNKALNDTLAYLQAEVENIKSSSK